MCLIHLQAGQDRGLQVISETFFERKMYRFVEGSIAWTKAVCTDQDFVFKSRTCLHSFWKTCVVEIMRRERKYFTSCRILLSRSSAILEGILRILHTIATEAERELVSLPIKSVPVRLKELFISLSVPTIRAYFQQFILNLI